MPYGASIRTDEDPWSFPKDTVLAKTLSLEMERGDSSSRRRIETQILHFDGQQWQPYTYSWNEKQTDAHLVDAEGKERTLAIRDSEAAGGTRQQVWRFSGRAECQRCHNPWSGPPLAFNTAQLNKEHDYGYGPVSQLDALSQVGLISKRPARAELPKLVNPIDSSASLNHRARSYLHTNCAHCHRLHAGSAVLSKMRFDLPLAKTDMLGMRPTQGTFGIHGAEVIAPGDPFRSVLWYRMSKLGGGRMPHIGSTEVDPAGVDLIHDWIQWIPESTTTTTSGAEVARKLRATEAATLEQLCDSTRLEREQIELTKELLATTSGALMLMRSIAHGELAPSVSSSAIELAIQRDEVAVRDLFERFLPPEKRVKRLGGVVRPENILSLDGDSNRGLDLFFNTAGIECKNCHRIQNEGKEVGPDLSTIGRKYSREQLLDSILAPSNRIDPEYVPYLAETNDGRIVTGLLSEKKEDAVILKDAQSNTIRIPSDQIERLVPQQQSLMPDLLVRDMTAQQVADLLAYLTSLK